MLIEKFKEKLKELTEESLRLNLIKAFLSKQLEEFAKKELEQLARAIITASHSNDFKGLNENYTHNMNGYQFEISVKFEKDLGFKK
jgi:tetrahydrodipicolinate N-succinyltransferase